MNENKNKKLDIIGLPNQPHAVRINQKSTTFYKIHADLAIARWFPLDISKGIGTGYLDYQVGLLKYESGVFGVTMVWEGLSKEDPLASSVILNATHNIYISSKAADLQSGSQC